MMDVQRAIENVQKAAKADTTRSGQAHVDLIDAMRTLNLAVETPAESLMRMRFEVRKILFNSASCLRSHVPFEAKLLRL